MKVGDLVRPKREMMHCENEYDAKGVGLIIDSHCNHSLGSTPAYRILWGAAYGIFWSSPDYLEIISEIA